MSSLSMVIQQTRPAEEHFIKVDYKEIVQKIIMEIIPCLSFCSMLIKFFFYSFKEGI